MGSGDTALASASRDVSTLWYTRCPVPTASGIAIEKGWLEEEFGPDGIVVSSLGASADMSVRESHFDHRQPDSFRQGGNIPPIWARSRGSDTRLIGVSWTNYYQAIIALPESGIADVADLKGRRLGLSKRVNDQIDFFRAGSLRGYVTALSQAGLSTDDAELVEVSAPDNYIRDDAGSQRAQLFGAVSNRSIQSAEVFALIRGEVDAICVRGSGGADLTAMLGARVVVDLGSNPDPEVRTNNTTPTILTVSGELLESRADLVTRYIAVVLTAARWAKTHALDVRRIVAEEESVAEAWVDVAHPDVHVDLDLALTPTYLAAIESQKRFLSDWGFIDGDFDLRAWVAHEPLAAAQKLVADGFGDHLLGGAA